MHRPIYITLILLIVSLSYRVVVIVGIDTVLVHAPLSVFMFGILVVRLIKIVIIHNIMRLLMSLSIKANVLTATDIF